MAKSKKENTVHNYILLIFFMLLPFIQVKALMDATLLPRYTLAAIASLALLGLAFKAIKEQKMPLFLLIASGGFLLVQVLSVISAYNPVESYFTISRYAVVLSYFWVILALLRSGKLSWPHFLQAGILFGGIASIATLFELLNSMSTGEFFDDIYQINGTFSHKNLLASALMMALPLCLAAWALLKKAWRTSAAIVSFLIVLEIFVLRTRGVWLGTFGAAAATAVLYFITKKKEQLPLKWLAALGGLAVVILLGLFSSSQIKAGFLNSSNIEKRLAFWHNSMDMISEHPALGVGAGNWKLIFPKYGLAKVDDSTMQGVTHIQRPHNDYLWVWAEAGPFGLLFYLSLFIIGLTKSINNIRHSEEREWRILNYFLFFGLSAYLLFSFGDFPLERAPHNILFFSLIALAFSRKTDREKTISAPWLFYFIPVALLFTLYVFSKRWEGEKQSQVVLEANARQDAQAIIPAAEAAVNSFYNLDLYANPIYYYSSMGYLFTKRPDEALRQLELAQDAAPYNILVLQAKANGYLRKEQDEKAMVLIDSALAISPHFEMALLTKAEMLNEQQRYAEALDVLNLHNPRSSSERYLRDLANALRGTVNTFEEHGRFEAMVKHLKNQPRLEQPMDYIRAYRQKRNVVD